MKQQRSYYGTREEKYALSTACIVFALSIITIYLLQPGSFLDVRQHEITVIISPNPFMPFIPPNTLSPPTGPPGVHGGGTRGQKKSGIIVPVPNPAATPDTSIFPGTVGNGLHDSLSSSVSVNGTILPGTIDTFLVLYPGYRHSALREEMKKSLPRTKKDSLLAWAKDNLMAQVIGNGRIDKATIDELLTRKRFDSYGPYHVVTPSIGIGVGFDYTELMKKIISIFEKAPKD
jgi:hypothetical protein